MNFSITLLSIFIGIAFFQDIKEMKIPNRLTVPFAAAGVVCSALQWGWEGFLFSLQGMAISFIIMFVLYLFSAVGAGDVKLFAAIGAIAGTECSLYGMMYSILFAGVIALIYWVWKRLLVKQLRWFYEKVVVIYLFRNMQSFRVNQDTATHFPFMLAVVPGVASSCILVGIQAG
ncbi:prepilin peptidase [Marinicrinis lubricantis]|uniref:Prepilin peptidase n=1 Tax=Marinicrinis lubricantis TaxID=2086470 RepID=A0ABW1ITA3_9BACL